MSAERRLLPRFKEKREIHFLFSLREEVKLADGSAGITLIFSNRAGLME